MDGCVRDNDIYLKLCRIMLEIEVVLGQKALSEFAGVAMQNALHLKPLGIEGCAYGTP